MTTEYKKGLISRQSLNKLAVWLSDLKPKTINLLVIDKTRD